MPDLLDSFLKPAPRKRGPKPSGKSERDSQRELMARKRAEARDIAEELDAAIEGIDWDRRRACENDLGAFAWTYFSEDINPEQLPGRRGIFCWEPSEMHAWAINTMQQIVLYGGMQAWATLRGGGKDTIAIIGAIWATVYGHTDFAVVACYDMAESETRIATIRFQLEQNALLRQDFPEVCIPAVMLNGSTQRGRTQQYRGALTNITWGSSYLKFAEIHGFPSSGRIIHAGSIRASIRGTNVEGRRPTLVIITDPQTREVANSVDRIAETMKLIRAEFGGLGSHGEQFAVMVLCTVIRHGDVAYQLTSRDICPEWGGRKDRAIEQWPERMDLWEQYIDLRRENKGDDLSGRKAHAFYLENREAMDAGGRVSWPAAYQKTVLPDGSQVEVSALQHFINKLADIGEDAFSAEFQNEPPESNEIETLKESDIAARVNGFAHQVVPPWTKFLVEGVDVGARNIHYSVLAVGADFTCALVDYGLLFTMATPEALHKNATPDERLALEQRIKSTLEQRRDEERDGIYVTPAGEIVHVDLHLVDSHWLTDVVLAFVRESGPRWRASFGFSYASNNRKYSAPKPGKDVKVGTAWYAKRDSRGVTYGLDADHWKLFTHERLAQSVGTPGSMTLYGDTPKDHRRLARHLTAERYNVEKQRWETLDRANHWFDTTAYACAGASMLGVRIIADSQKQRVVADYSIGAAPANAWKIGR